MAAHAEVTALGPVCKTLLFAAEAALMLCCLLCCSSVAADALLQLFAAEAALMLCSLLAREAQGTSGSKDDAALTFAAIAHEPAQVHAALSY